MPFMRAPLVRPTPGFNYNYDYFIVLINHMMKYYSLDWFELKKASIEKRDLVATYNMGQEL